MFFPTSGLNLVHRIPETIWRQAEEAYRTALSQACSAAADEAMYGAGLAAACACWALALCHGNLSLETAVASDQPWVDLVRQRHTARLEQFVQATVEFGSLAALGAAFADLLSDWRSRWPTEAIELPFYPAFQEQGPRPPSGIDGKAR